MKRPINASDLHLASAINSEIKREPEKHGRAGNTIRVLDLGCGKGRFLAFASNVLPLINPNVKFEFYGYEIREHGARSEDYSATVIKYLNSEAPQEHWEKRIAVTSSTDNLPYSDEFFDYVISNHVLEHVMDPEFLFKEMHRCLTTNGISINLFPVKEVLNECHLHLPFAHKISNLDTLRGYIKTRSLIGRGRFFKWRPEGMSAEEYAELRVHYMRNHTNYQSSTEYLSLAERHGFKASCSYTLEFYTSRLLSLLREAPKYEYRTKRSAFVDKAAFALLRYIGSITLVMEKG